MTNALATVVVIGGLFGLIFVAVGIWMLDDEEDEC
jgi:hypothetical protein